MRKLLLAGLSLLFCATANAGIVSLDTISADSTISVFNSNFTKLANANNGQVQGSGTTGSTTNILSRSIGELDMADEINPRVRAAELLGIGVDTTSAQAALVYTGLIPATSASLTSNISAGTAYINGYRVAKTATSETYTASKDTYVDLSQTGAYTLSAVTNGASAPTVAANSARIAKVVTSGTAITSVTSLYSTRIPGLVIPSNYRDGMYMSRDTTTTIIVGAGTCEVNNAILSKTTNTTLTLNTAGDWAGGASLQATSTYGYVGIDSSGNLKMHTTAPAFSDYAVSKTVGTLRYATWSSTVYRIIGWFFMNATGSGQLDTYGVSNFKDGTSFNTVTRNNQTADTISDTGYGTQLTNTTINFYSSGRPVLVRSEVMSSAANGMDNNFMTVVSVDGGGGPIAGGWDRRTSQGTTAGTLVNTNTILMPQGTHTILVRGKVDASNDMINNKVTEVTEQ